MEGKTHKPSPAPGKGSGKTARDASVATPMKGGGTKMVDRTKGNHLKRGTGSFKSYK